MTLNQPFIAPCILSLLVALSSVVQAKEELPSAARGPFDKGMLAAQQQEWPTAIRYFLEAQKAATYVPEVLMNLGLAESKVPGRELRAIAWFGAYLTRCPNASNADAVRKETAALEIRVEATIEKLINQAKQLIAQEQEDYRSSHYGDTAVAQAAAGDVGGAKTTASKASFNDGFYAHDALAKIAAIQWHRGDIAAAENTIQEIGHGGSHEHPYSMQSNAYGYIACLQSVKGDFSGAEASIERAKWAVAKVDHYMSLALEEALAGKRDQAKSHLGKALRLFDQHKDKVLDNPLHGAARLLAFLGDVEAGEKLYARWHQEAKKHAAIGDLDMRGFKYLYEERAIREGVERQRRANLGFIADENLLKQNKSSSSAQDVELIRLLREQLSNELFTDQQSAIRTIADKERPSQIVDGVLEAIRVIATRLNDLKALSR